MHGSIFSSGRDSGGCDGLRGAEGWRVVPQGSSSRHSRSKVVKVVCLEVFFPLSASGFRLGPQSHHGEADRGASCASVGGMARCVPGEGRASSRRLVGVFPERRPASLGSLFWILPSGYRVFHPGGGAGSGRPDEEAVLAGTRGFHHAGKRSFPECGIVAKLAQMRSGKGSKGAEMVAQWETLLTFLSSVLVTVVGVRTPRFTFQSPVCVHAKSAPLTEKEMKSSQTDPNLS